MPQLQPIARKYNDEIYLSNRILAFERDGWKCTQCGSRERLQAHHIETSPKRTIRPFSNSSSREPTNPVRRMLHQNTKDHLSKQPSMSHHELVNTTYSTNISMVNLLGPGIGISVLVVAIVIYLVAMRTQHHYNSTLTCPNCQHTFEYRWMPLASFSAIRIASERVGISSARRVISGRHSTSGIQERKHQEARTGSSLSTGTNHGFRKEFHPSDAQGHQNLCFKKVMGSHRQGHQFVVSETARWRLS